MKREDRAKQFMPFAALKGYEAALREKEKIVVKRIELTEEYKDELDRVLHELKVRDIVTVTYYKNDEYLEMTGMVSRIDITARLIKVVNEKIEFDNLYRLEIKKG